MESIQDNKYKKLGFSRRSFLERRRFCGNITNTDVHLLDQQIRLSRPFRQNFTIKSPLENVCLDNWYNGYCHKYKLPAIDSIIVDQTKTQAMETKRGPKVAEILINRLIE